MGEYKDRSIATIQHDVEKQFNEIKKRTECEFVMISK